MSEAVTVSAPDGHMVYCNQAAAELLGAESPEELADAVGSELAARFRITREDGALVSPEDLPHRHVLAGRRPAPLLTRSVHLASGRTRWLLTTSRPLDDETGPLAVNTILDVTQSTEAERRRRLLAEAASQLAAPHRLEETLGDVAALAVPTLADWCAVDLADAGGGLRRVALAHRDPALVDRARELQARYPADAGDSLPARVLRSGRPLLVPEISEAMLAARARGAEHLADLRGLGVRSVLTVPVTAGGAVVGALSLAQADSRRVLGEDDVAYAADVAALLGTALAA